jgi:serine/threonine protein kinase
MTVSSDWERVNQLFHEALALAPDARAAFVKTRAGDAHVFQEVMSLLQTCPAAEGFLSNPPDSAQLRAVLARLQPGDELGPFRITSLIGAGGMGEVYRAWDTRLDRQVAIKVLPQVSAIDDAGRERFEAEARAISRLTHPRISTLYDVGSASVGSMSVQYLVMELVEGETLAARLKRGPLAVDQALAIAIEIAEALAAAHAAGVIHRDVKPANIMLTRSGAKLLDFGLARLRPSLGVGHAASGAGDPATHPTGLFGTLPYMAPELLRGAGADARTDLFAFGAVLYEMLAGSPAFAAGSEADLVAAILEREPTAISARQPQTPPSLERLIATCLAKDPDERWQTAQDLVRALRWVRDDQSRPASSAPTAHKLSWKTVAWAAVGVTLLGLLIATAVRQPPVSKASRVTFPVFAPPGTQFPRRTAAGWHSSRSQPTVHDSCG